MTSMKEFFEVGRPGRDVEVSHDNEAIFERSSMLAQSAQEIVAPRRQSRTNRRERMNTQEGQGAFRKVEDRFQSETFVDVMPKGSTPETKTVRSTNIDTIYFGGSFVPSRFGYTLCYNESFENNSKVKKKSSVLTPLFFVIFLQIFDNWNDDDDHNGNDSLPDSEESRKMTIYNIIPDEYRTALVEQKAMYETIDVVTKAQYRTRVRVEPVLQEMDEYLDTFDIPATN